MPLMIMMWALALMGSAQARCVVNIAHGDNVRSSMDAAIGAGCSVFFEAGTHTVTARLAYTLVGTEADPVVIGGASAATTRLLRPDAAQNLLDLSGEHFVLQDLELVGGSKGVRLELDVRSAVFQRLEIHGTADSAFTANTNGSSYTDIVIRDSELYDTAGYGECLYLGCNAGACTFGDALVEGNFCHDTHTDWPGLQGDGLDLKGGAYNVVVRDNVFRDTDGPGILTYANGGAGQNLIEGNVVWRPNGTGIQFTGDTRVRSNVVILDAAGVGINGSASNQGTPDDVQVVHNTVVNTSGSPDAECLALRGWTSDTTGMLVAGNALYCPRGTAFFMRPGEHANATVRHNAVEGALVEVPSGTFDGGSLSTQLEDVAGANVYPRPGSVLLGQGPIRLRPSRDFNCALRIGPSTVGAYEWTGPGNPGWTGADDFKSCPP